MEGLPPYCGSNGRMNFRLNLQNNYRRIICVPQPLKAYAQNLASCTSVLLYIIYIFIPQCNYPHLPTLPALLWAHTLWIKETSHPKYIGPPLKYPSRKLSVSFQKFSEPEAQCGWIPGHSFPDLRYASIIHVVQGVSQILKKVKLKYKNKRNQQKREMTIEIIAHLTHNDCSLNGQF